MRRTILAVVVFSSVPLLAQTPYLVKDINTTYTIFPASSFPRDFVGLNGKVFFTAQASQDSFALFASVGFGAAKLGEFPRISSPSVVNGVVVFGAYDTANGIEPWVSDGTAEGTHLLKDIAPGVASSSPSFGAVYQNRMLFSATEPTTGTELWVTDGSAAGTNLVADITPGPSSSSPSDFVPFGGAIYFAAANALWKTDGTGPGPVKVVSVEARDLAVAGSKLFFEGNTTAAGWEPWVSDGTEAGTHMIADILPGIGGSLFGKYDIPLVTAGDRVFFFADDGVHGREMWVSDGTSTGTHMVRDFVSGAAGQWDGRVPAIVGFGDRVYFSFIDAAHGNELWVSDGTDSGTALFADCAPGPASSNPGVFAVADGKLYFATLTAGATGIWVSDGTAAGTRRLTDISLGSTLALQPIDGRIYFDGMNQTTTGDEPWVIDGLGPHIIANLAPDPVASSNPRNLTVAGNLIFFYATDGPTAPAVGLWRTDGTEAGTFRLTFGNDSLPLYPAGRFILFATANDSSKLAMMSDGTAAGTKPIADFQRRFGAPIGKVYSFGDTVYASIQDIRTVDFSLWKTIGVPNAPAIRLGTMNPYGVIEVPGGAMFYADSATGGHSLWFTDGTPAGTHAILADLGDLENRETHPLVNAGGTVFFLKRLRGENWQLWRTDGTAAGTVALKEWPVTAMPPPRIQAAGRHAFVYINGALWASDGTESGTNHVVDDSSITFFDLYPAADRLVFVRDTRTDVQLWGSDGAADDPKFLASLGLRGSLPASVDGLVYFGGIDSAHGRELWSTDGTPDGTRMVVDIEPGPASSTPGSFVKLGDTLYFRANTVPFGGELWAFGPRIVSRRRTAHH